MDSKVKFKLNLKIWGFMKHSHNCFVAYLWLMFLIKELWFVMVVYQVSMVLL